ncbi:hypothetical protein HS096_03550 [candidate division WWE3 bacterium]|uniref:Uncharacterized protein n=1 Tax=candidate division WWE3 bacterium TaxID=2053526 RepID=A0A928TX86_UNCKA|nr:hypothetical protein [candidate division WWE3 bacterium]
MSKDVDAAKGAGEDIAALAEEGPEAFLSSPPPLKASGQNPASMFVPEDEDDEPRLGAIIAKAPEQEIEERSAEESPAIIAVATASESEDEDEDDEPRLGAIIAKAPEQEEMNEVAQANEGASDEPNRAAVTIIASAMEALEKPSQPSLDIPVVEGSLILGGKAAGNPQPVLRSAENGSDAPDIEISPATNGEGEAPNTSGHKPMSRIGEEASIPLSRAGDRPSLSDSALGGMIEEWIGGNVTVDGLREVFREQFPLPAGLFRLLIRLDEIALSHDEARSEKAAWCRGGVFAELIARGHLEDIGEPYNVRDQQWFVNHGAQTFLHGETDPARQRCIHAALELFHARLTQHTGMDRELADAARGEADRAEKDGKAETPPDPETPNPTQKAPAPAMRRSRVRSFDRNLTAIAAGSVMLAASVVLIALGPMGFGSRHVPPQPKGTVAMPASVPVKTPAQTTLAASTTPSPMSECVTIEPDEGVVADCVKGTRTDLGEGRMKLCGCTLY